MKVFKIIWQKFVVLSPLFPWIYYVSRLWALLHVNPAVE